MILTAHLLTGATLSAKIKITPLAFLLAFLSHYFLDSLPHQDYSVKNIKERRWRESRFDFLKIILDFSFGILLILTLYEKGAFSSNPILILAGGFFAVLADGFTFLHLIFPKNNLLKKHYYFHKKTIHSAFFRKGRVPLFWKIASQILIIILAILSIFYLR